MRFVPEIPPLSKMWLMKKGYVSPVFLAKGKSAGIWVVKKNRKTMVAKIEHVRSTRNNMALREATFLKQANHVGVGPALCDFSVDDGIVVMELVKGIPLAVWLENCTDKKILSRVLEKLFEQARKLDAIGLDHGQLGGKLHNIIVTSKHVPVIIDFEKSSQKEKPRNVSKLFHLFLSGKTSFAKKIESMIDISLLKNVVGKK